MFRNISSQLSWRYLTKEASFLLILFFVFVILDFLYVNLHVMIFDRFASTFVHDQLDDERYLKFTFLDIDDKTQRGWENPLVTPRRDLVDLLEKTLERAEKAKAIIVDINTSYCHADLGRKEPGRCLNEGHDDADKKLLDWAERHKGKPPVILTRIVEPTADKETQDCQVMERSVLDDIVKPGLGNGNDFSQGIHWAAPSFRRNFRDGVVRNWQLWVDICKGDQRLIMPSVQLLTLLSIHDEGSELAKALIYGLEQVRSGEAKSAPVLSIDRAREIDFGDRWRAQRIIYSVPWNADKTEEVPLYDGLLGEQGWFAPSLPDDVYWRQSATDVDQLSPYYFDDRIIVVGASHRQSGDLYPTPIGMMPGAVILINAIQSLHGLGTIKEAPVWLRGLVIAGVALMLMGLSIMLHPLMAAWTMTLGVGSFCFILIYTWPHQGLWLDAALATALFFLLRGLIETANKLIGWTRAGFPIARPDNPLFR